MDASHLIVPKRPSLYCRLSYAPDGSLEKVERQEADGRAMGARLNWPEFCCVYVDNSRSAWQRNRKRPDWDRMLRTLDASGERLVPHDPKANHQHDGIMVYHGDRLIRQPYDLELLLSLADTRRIPLASVSGVRDLASPDDRFILRIEAAQACRESDNISRRVRRGVRARVAKGLSPTSGGRRPYGYGIQVGTRTKTDPTTGEDVTRPVFDTNQQVPEEIKYIKGGVERMLAGLNQSATVRWLNEAGALTTEGNAWTTKSWRNVMLSPRIAGLIEREGQLHPAVWDGAVPVETWEAVKALYRENAEQHPYQGRERKYLLTGIAECYQCHKIRPDEDGRGPVCKGAECAGPHLTVRTKPVGGRNRKNVRLYYCPSCRGVGRNVVLLDAYVEGRVLQLLSSERFITELHRVASEESGTDLQTQITALEQRRDTTREELEDLADHPDVNATLAMLSIASFDRKIAELRARMGVSARLRRLVRMAGISREAWAAEAIDVRAAVVKDLYRVVILPTSWRGPGFDPSSVRLERRPLAARDDAPPSRG